VARAPPADALELLAEVEALKSRDRLPHHLIARASPTDVTSCCRDCALAGHPDEFRGRRELGCRRASVRPTLSENPLRLHLPGEGCALPAANDEVGTWLGPGRVWEPSFDGRCRDSHSLHMRHLGRLNVYQRRPGRPSSVVHAVAKNPRHLNPMDWCRFGLQRRGRSSAE
jgi:hypothetical protein